jgi:lipoprotein-releasing system permease protein
MRYEWFIAQKYLKPKGGATFIFLLTMISMTGVALGVASLITVLSVMNGFGHFLRSSMIQVSSHIIMEYPDNGGLSDPEAIMTELEKLPNVDACSPMVSKWGLIQRTDYPINDTNRVNIVSFVGIDPEREAKVTGIKDFLVTGSFDGFKEEKRPPESSEMMKLDQLVAQRSGEKKLPGIIIGTEMAGSFFVINSTKDTPDEEAYKYVIGQRLTIMTMPNDVVSFAEAEPSERTFAVEGVFKTGNYEYDSALVYTSLLSAQTMLEIPQGRVPALQFKLHDHSQDATDQSLMNISSRSQEMLGRSPSGNTWMRQHQVFFRALAYEKLVMDCILKIIILVATFNIIATIFMVVTDKTRDIGLLRAIGAGRKNIMLIFIFFGLIVGALGVTLGITGGLGVCTFIKTVPITLPGDGQVYYMKYLPCRMIFSDFLWVSVYTMVISFLASIYPAIRASRLVPVDALRFS